MRRVTILCLLLPLLPVARAEASAGPPVLAGAAKVDSSWHLGASAGQYASDGFAVGSHGVEPYQHQTRRSPSYGLQSRNWVRALIVQGSNGERVAIVANDLYIPQDLVNRRVAGLLEEHDRLVALGLKQGAPTGIDETNMTISVSHSHSSPYYSTPSWGVWAFQDVFDVRFFEYVAGRMAQAVIDAAADMHPVRMGASVSRFSALQKHSFGPAVADDGTPAGYPRTDVDARVTVLRFDRTDTDAPLATWVVFGLHPEFLDGNDLMTGEYVNTMYRIIDREIGGVTLFSQNDTGTSEAADHAQAHPPSERAEYSHAEYAQIERGVRKLAGVVEDTWHDIEAGTPELPGEYVPFSDSFPVRMSDMRFAPPSLRALPSVSNCRAEQAFHGNPGIPIAGLPDCEYPLRGASPVDPGVTYDTLREAGVPVPDNTSAPSYTGLEETLQVHLQAIRMGGVGITVCPCEQWADQSRNIRSRLNKVHGDVWHGFDWTEAYEDFCVRNADTTWTCRNPRDLAQWLAPVSDERYRRMKAQIHNDARGWEDLAYAPYAETEEVDVDAIKGNYTHEELTPFGYDLVVTVGMSNDYWGYIATYREYQRGDHYRKALTGLGPHSSDFLATRLSRMAASLNGAPPVQSSAKDLVYAPEDVHEHQRAQAVGELARTALPAYEATLPADGGTPAIVSQPASIERFDAARVSWIGGDNYFDMPDVRVERREGDTWHPYADGSGEVQFLVHYPAEADLVAWRTGAFEWRWDATFEAFCSDVTLPDASGVQQTCTPEGTYRFTIDGARHAGLGVVEPYRLESEPFEVRAWSGITVDDPDVGPDGVSFAVGPVNVFAYRNDPRTFVHGPIDYPDTYDSPFRFIAGRVEGDENLRRYPDGSVEEFCMECSFRPWADTGTVATATFTVTRDDGSVELHAATFAGGRVSVPVVLAPGDSVSVEVVDGFGQRGTASLP